MTASEVLEFLKIVKRATTEQIAIGLCQPKDTVKSAIKTLRNNDMINFEEYRIKKQGQPTYFWSLKND